MNKFFLLLYLVFAIVHVNAQTKVEAEGWIISKIDKYKETEYFGGGGPNLGFSSKIISVKFADCSLIILRIAEGARIKKGFEIENFTATATLTIPLDKLSDVTYTNGKLYFNTIHDNITWKTDDPKCPANNTVTYESFALIAVNLNAEEDLPNRMVKAFTYMRDTYCKKEGEPKEIF